MSRKKTGRASAVKSVSQAPPARSSGPSPLYIAAALALLTVAVFAGVAHNDFVGVDDDRYVFDNPVVSKGLTAEGLGYAFFTYKTFYWHPLTWLSHMTDCQLFGLWAGGHHLTSLLIHTVNVLLLFLLLRRITGTTWSSAAAAALFAIHPLRVESVAWVAERKDVLGCLFWLLTLWVWVEHVRSGGSRRKYAWALLLFVGALMSKPSTVTLPFVLLLLDYWPLERLRRASAWGLVKEKLPFFALSLASSVLTYVGQKSFGAMEEMARVPLAGRLANAVVAYVAYLRDVFWPGTLAVNYPYAENVPAWMWLAAVALLAGITVLALRQTGRGYLAVGWLWFLGVIVPMIGLVQVGMQSRADRFTYMPSIRLSILLAWGGAELAARLALPRPALVTVTAAILVALAVRARAQVPVWHDTVRLLEHAVAVTSGNELAHYNLGYEYLVQHRAAEAERQFRTVVQLNPRAVNYLTSLGHALYQQERYAEALAAFNRAVELDPDYGAALANRGLTLKRLGQPEQALASLRRAIASGLSAKQAADTHNEVAGLLMAQNRLPEAAAELREAIKLNPDLQAARANLARVLAALGDRK